MDSRHARTSRVIVSTRNAQPKAFSPAVAFADRMRSFERASLRFRAQGQDGLNGTTVVGQFEFRPEEFGAVGTELEASTQSRHTNRLNQAGCCFAIWVLVQCACNRREGKTGISNSPLTAETKALRKAYAAFSRNDIAATVEALDPQIEWTEPGEFPGDGTYYGHEGVGPTCRNRARPGPRYAARRSDLLSSVTRSLCLFMRELNHKTAPDGTRGVRLMSSRSATAKPFKCVHSPTGARPLNGLDSKTRMQTDHYRN